MAGLDVSDIASLARPVSYFPNIPPRAPKAAMSYSRAVESAPFTALMGVVVDGRQLVKHPVTPRCRMRSQVGCTNRWRLPDSLSSDLLGISQASKAISQPYNASMRRIISAENPKNLVNVDVSRPYAFRASDDRPFSHTGHPDTCSHQTDRTTHSPTRTDTCQPVRKFLPGSARPPKPMDIFHYHSKRTLSTLGPDETKHGHTRQNVLLECLGMTWELHRPFLQKAESLAEQLATAPEATQTKYYRNQSSATLDKYISRSKYYSNEYQEMSNRLSTVDKTPEDKEKGLSHPKHVSQQRISNMTVIKLDIKDPMVEKHCLAVALGNLYHEDLEVDVSDVVGVMAAAHHLRFTHLVKGCANIMINSISSGTVCAYHKAAVKYHQDRVEVSCERWLELNLVPKLGTQIQLKELPLDLLHRILKSNRLFTFGEFALYRVVVYWVFLQLNPPIQLMPSYTTLQTYFNSLPKLSSLIESEEGQDFASLFMSLRLHGITDMNNLHDVQSMNIIPHTWVVKIFSQHYTALQGGGDMSLMNNFNSGSLRQGFLIDAEPHYHSEILSLYGFHFELKATRESGTNGKYSFFMQRLKPSDPVLSFRQCERHTFSMRPDREVRYAVRVQHFDRDMNCQMATTGMMSQRFGLGDKTSKSQTLTVEGLRPPLYVTFSILFPPS